MDLESMASLFKATRENMLSKKLSNQIDGKFSLGIQKDFSKKNKEVKINKKIKYLTYLD